MTPLTVCPVESRLLHVADALDQMARPSALRRARPLREAILGKGGGTLAAVLDRLASRHPAAARSGKEKS